MGEPFLTPKKSGLNPLRTDGFIKRLLLSPLVKRLEREDR